MHLVYHHGTSNIPSDRVIRVGEQIELIVEAAKYLHEGYYVGNLEWEA